MNNLKLRALYSDHDGEKFVSPQDIADAQAIAETVIANAEASLEFHRPIVEGISTFKPKQREEVQRRSAALVRELMILEGLEGPRSEKSSDKQSE